MGGPFFPLVWSALDSSLRLQSQLVVSCNASKKSSQVPSMHTCTTGRASSSCRTSFLVSSLASLITALGNKKFPTWPKTVTSFVQPILLNILHESTLSLVLVFVP